MSVKSPPPYLGEFELLILLAIVRLEADAYGVRIQEALSRETGREANLGAIYRTLGRMEDKKLVSAWVGAPTAERGGRRRKHYRLEPLGVRAVKHAIVGLRRLTRGLDSALEAL